MIIVLDATVPRRRTESTRGVLPHAGELVRDRLVDHSNGKQGSPYPSAEPGSSVFHNVLLELCFLKKKIICLRLLQVPSATKEYSQEWDLPLLEACPVLWAKQPVSPVLDHHIPTLSAFRTAPGDTEQCSGTEGPPGPL